MADKLRDSDVLLRVRTYPSPPKNLRLPIASRDELLRYGFPRRPDPVKEPQLDRLWKRALDRPIRFEQAQVAIDPVMSARDPLARGPDRFGATGWAGVVKLMSSSRTADFNQPATMVFAHWQLPFVPSVSPNETIAVAFWVGIDGDPALGEPASKQVLQAGIAAQVNPPSWPLGSASTKWWAWTEWYTEVHRDSAVAVKNFPVASGDEIFVVVCAPQPDFGFVSMLNLTRGIGRSVGFQAPEGITVLGRSAEWIVEVPSGSPHMPLFSPVTFNDCTAGSLQHGIFNLTGGIPNDIRSPSTSSSPFGSPLTKTTIASPTIAVVEELEVDWF